MMKRYQLVGRGVGSPGSRRNRQQRVLGRSVCSCRNLPHRVRAGHRLHQEEGYNHMACPPASRFCGYSCPSRTAENEPVRS